MAEVYSGLVAEDHIWFKHPDRVWGLGRIDGREGEGYRVVDVDTGDQFVCEAENTHTCDPTHLENQEDIARMNNMHEGPLLHLLKVRYLQDQIYTFTGDILISMNPYMRIDGLYDIPDVLHDYENDRHPHVYAVADKAYRCMMGALDPSKRNQSLIVSGESGAGKTEGCKCVMRYLASISERFVASSRRRSSAARVNEETVKIEKQVLDCNPFLEAFGNAKTVRNDNSSRFGKFLKIQYDGGRIMGATMEHYLLEKARVVRPCVDERNYHIFYQLIRGADPDVKEELHLTEPEDFRYIRDVVDVDNMDDAREFADVQSAMTSVGIKPDVQMGMWRILAGLLHLGNVDFHNDGGDSPAEVSNKGPCGVAQDLLGAQHLDSKLVTRMVNVQGRQSCYVVQLTPRQAEGARDALAKAVYEKMFAWLVARVNHSLEATKPSSGFIGILDIFGFEIFQTNSFEQLCINFANEKLQSLFNHHVFEAEQAQYKAEGVDMSEVKFINNKPCVELIESSPYGILTMLDEVCRLGRDPSDENLLDKIDKQHSGKHSHYVQKRPRRKPTFGVAHFAGTVSYHIDGFIEKNNDTLFPDLLMLMQVSTRPFMREIFTERKAEESKSSSSSSSGSSSRKGSRRKRGGGGKRRGGSKSSATIASKFKGQLSSLNNTLMATNPHYVRCVKPNTLKQTHNFDADMILGQLLYSGVLETVRIRRMGYPFRESYVDFWRRCTLNGWQVMAPSAKALPHAPPADFDDNGRDRNVNAEVLRNSKAGAVAVCEELLDAKQWTTGRTKIFMKGSALDVIQGRFRNITSRKLGAWTRGMFGKWHFKRYRRAMVHLQKRWRAYLMRKQFAAVEKQVTVLQAHVRRRKWQRRFRAYLAVKDRAAGIVGKCLRGNSDRRRFLRARGGTTKLQAHARRRVAAVRFATMLRGFTRLQAVQRGRRSRELQHKESSVVKIQATFRGFKARRRVARLKQVKVTGCVTIQANVRRYLAQKRYRALLRGTRLAQRLYRGVLGRRTAAQRRRALVVLKDALLGYVWRRRYLCIIAGFSKFQAVVRGHMCRHRLNEQRDAANRIEKAVGSFLEATRLGEWTQELHAACSWGDAVEVEALLKLTDMRWARLGSIPRVQRTRIRNRFDGLKSVLHSAAASGDEATVELLLSPTWAAQVDVVDLFGATPLHNSCSLGDSHLPVTRRLVAAGQGQRATLLGRRNLAGETALDLVVLARRSNMAGMGGAGAPDTFAQTAAFLLANGAPTDYPDEAKAAAAAAAAGAGSAGHRGLGLLPEQELIVAQAERREKEVLQRRRKERLSDPHYQFLFVAAEEKRRKEAEAVARAEAAARAAEREGERVVWDRRRMREEEDYSRQREHRDREAEKEREERAALAAAKARQAELQNMAAEAERARRQSEAAARAEAERAAAEAAAKATADAERAARLRREQETLDRLARERAQRLQAEEDMALRRAAEEERRRVERERRREAAAEAQARAEAEAARERAARVEQAKREREQRRLRRLATEASPASPSSHSLMLGRGAAGGGGSSAATAAADASAGSSAHTSKEREPRSRPGSASQASRFGGGAGSAAARAGGNLKHGAASPLASSGPPSGEPRAGTSSSNNRAGAARGAASASTNGTTGRATVPKAAGADATDAAIADAWEELETEDGVLYFYNSLTGDTTWEVPPGYVPRLSSSDSDSDVSTGEGGGGGGGGVGVVQVIDGEEWEELETEAGLLYYHSLTNGTVQWTPPAGFVVQPDAAPDSEHGAHRGSGSDDDDGGYSDDGGSQYSSEGSDEEWEVLSTDSGHEYYFNRRTRTTTWERPAELSSRADRHGGSARHSRDNSKQAGRSAGQSRSNGNGTTGRGDGVTGDDASGSGSGDVAVGRNGWVTVKGPDGQAYYYNEGTGLTQLQRPSDF